MSKEMNPSIKDMLEALESDNDFRTLKQKYESPNEFTIMGNKRREEWHSSFVSWLLNPKQNHKLGKFPLEKFSIAFHFGLFPKSLKLYLPVIPTKLPFLSNQGTIIRLVIGSYLILNLN